MSGKWTARDLPSLAGRVAIVTGANSGLGLETSAGLAQAGATVVMACRNPERANPALQAVRQRAPQATVETLPLDLADLASIAVFAESFAARFGALDILCNNAGVMALPYARTRDDFEMQIGTNHLGHFALTGRLLHLLLAAPAARVVTVASIAHKATRGIDLDDLNWERKPYSKGDAYAKSKLANLLFHHELDRRLRAQGARAISVAAHPGYASTNIGFAEPNNVLKRLAMTLGNALFAQAATMGALPTLYAAGAADVAGGDYIGPDGFIEFRGHPTKVQSRPEARDPATAARLWELSERLTGVRYP